MKGGRAKLNTAYTYLAIDINMMMQHNMILLNKWIHEQSQLCTCRSEDKERNCALTNSNNWVIGENQELVLVCKFDIVQNLYANKLQMQNNNHFNTFVNNTLGFCIINKGTYKNTEAIVSIYDVCMTDKNRKGYGKALFAVIQTYMEISFTSLDPIVWLGIRVDNHGFDKVCNIYTSFGYKDPYISQVDPFGNKLPFSFLSLQKPLHEFINTEEETKMTYNHCLFLKDNFIRQRTNPSHIASTSLYLDKSCLYKMRLFPYLTVGGILPFNVASSPIQNHREYSGSLVIISNNYDANKTLSNKLSFLTIGKNLPIKYTTGSTESVQMTYDSFTYHTHPLAVYAKYNVSIGTPSGGDVTAFLSGLLPFPNEETLVTHNINQCHFVISIEGIYCLSLHEKFLKSHFSRMMKYFRQSMNSFYEFVNMVGSTLEYPFDYRRYDWNEIIIDYNGPNYPETLIDQHLGDYFKWFETANGNIKYQNVLVGPVIKCEFKSWKALFGEQMNANQFNIHFPAIYKNFFMSSRDFKAILSTHGNQFADLLQQDAY